VRGILHKNKTGRWEIVGDDGSVELTSGSVIEICVAGIWHRTRVEHDGRDYYSVTPGTALVAGLPARLPNGGA
jgi:hypothetical protein